MIKDFLNRRIAERARKGTFLIMINRPNQTWSNGSGFFVSKEKFLTCFHVVFGMSLKEIRSKNILANIAGVTEKEKLENYIQSQSLKINIQFPSKTSVPATLVKFDEKHDAALLSVEAKGQTVIVPKINLSKKSQIGEYVYFGGFPTHHSYTSGLQPFAAHEGMVSSLTETDIGGEKYEHIQMDGINLGGNSGAPLFNDRATEVVGIINGNHNWGNDNLLALIPNNPIPQRISFRVPLSIAYATQLNTLKEANFL